MKHFMSLAMSGLMMMAMAVALLPTPTPIAAQDGSDADRIQRVLDAAQNSDFNSYIQTSVQSTETTISLDLMGFQVAVVQSSNFETSATVIINGDDVNVDMAVVGTVVSSTDAPGESTSGSATVEANFRYVDNTLYLRVTAIEVTGELDLRTDYPDGWVIVARVPDGVDPSSEIGFALSGTIFESLELGIFSQMTDMANGLTGPLGSDVTEFLNVATNATERQVTLADGQSVDAVTVVLDLGALLASDNEDLDLDLPDDLDLSGLDALFDGTRFEIDFYINDDEQLIGTGTRLNLGFATDDIASLLGEAEAEGLENFDASILFDIAIDNMDVVSNINADFSPVAAPTDAVPFN